MKKRKPVFIAGIGVLLYFISLIPHFFFPNSFVGGGDAVNYIWLLWHTHTAILSADFRSLFYTSLQFYPVGASIRFDTPILNSLITLPSYICCGSIAAYNSLIFITFALTFAGMYLFLKDLASDTKAAILGAIAFTFSYYRLIRFQEGHADLLSTEWIGFFLFFFFRAFRTRKLIDIVGLIGALVLQAYTDYRNFIILVVIAGFLFGWKFFTFQKTKSIASSFLLGSILGILPLFVLHKNLLMNQTLFEHIDGDKLFIQSSYATDLVSLLLPSYDVFTFVPGSTAFKVFSDQPVYLGWFSLALIFYYFLFHKRSMRENLHILFWSIFGFIFLVFSFGFGVKIFGRTYLTSPLFPYSLIYQIPFFSLFHVPSRFIIGVHIALAVLVAYSIKSINVSILKDRRQWVLGICVFFLIIQNAIFISPRVNRKESNLFLTHLAQAEDGAVLDIPFGYVDAFHEMVGTFRKESLLDQITHKRPILGGYLSVITPSTYKRYEQNEIIRRLIACQEDYVCDPFNAQERADFLRQFQIKYIFIHNTEKYDHMKVFLMRLYPHSVLLRYGKQELMEVVID